MSDLRTEHLEREAHVWADFERLVRLVPLDRWEADDVLEGWTMKGMLWHVAGWIDEASLHLEQMAAGTFVEVSEEAEDDTDVRNAGFAEAATKMTAVAVWDGLLAARELCRERWRALPEVTDRAIEEFAAETYQHYKEHIGDLERAAKP
jgi:hypothetical protein